jgi:hypothetical protein
VFPLLQNPSLDNLQVEVKNQFEVAVRRLGGERIRRAAASHQPTYHLIPDFLDCFAGAGFM